MPQTLYRWRKEFSTKKGISFPGKGKFMLTETELELARLKRKFEITNRARHTKEDCRHLLQERKQISRFIKDDTELFQV